MRIRDMVVDYQNKIASKDDLQPEKAAKYMTELSALLGNINDRIKETELAYNKKLLQCYESEEKANRAKILAETSQEYDDKLTAKNVKEVAIQMIGSLKYYLRAKEQEYRLGGNQ